MRARARDCGAPIDAHHAPHPTARQQNRWARRPRPRTLPDGTARPGGGPLSRRIRSATGIAAALLTPTAAWGSLLVSPAGAATAGEIRSCPSYGSVGMARCTVQGGAII